MTVTQGRYENLDLDLADAAAVGLGIAIRHRASLATFDDALDAAAQRRGIPVIRH